MQHMNDLVANYEKHLGLAEQWLAGRGLSMDMAATFRLGVVVDDSPESRPYRKRLAIPYLTPAGVVDIRFRAMGEGRGPKYLSRPGTKGHLYNVEALFKDSDAIAICEGEFDTMVMDVYSGIPAVGVPGVSMWKRHYNRLFIDYERVLVIGDGDDAGREFASHLAGEVPNAIPVAMAPGMDINSLFAQNGDSALSRLIAA